MARPSSYLSRLPLRSLSAAATTALPSDQGIVRTERQNMRGNAEGNEPSVASSVPPDDRLSSKIPFTMDIAVDPRRQRFPFCIVWTPLPILTYFLPFIGHMGIATSAGVIRDFAGPYHVSEDNMAFGKPTKYWQLDHGKARGGAQGWDSAVSEASEIYKTRMHNICCDNCHSHVATALNVMSYDGSTEWNMVKLAILMTLRGKYVSFLGFLKTWVPFALLVAVVSTICVLSG